MGGVSIATESRDNREKLAETAVWLRRRAGELGFEMAGIAPAVSVGGASRLLEWLDRGYQGEMGYLDARRSAYANPGSVLEGARTLVMLSMDYRTAEPSAAAPGMGRVARYAWGSVDYHDLIHDKLDLLKRELLERHPEATARGVVDSAPLLERDYAELAGLGWRGKNTLLLHRERGSFFFLACLLTSLDLPIETSIVADHCGTCTACLDACPTEAFVGPNLLDARKCISYLTIELKDAIPMELRPRMGDWLFGCDVCQEVCPWNRFAEPTSEMQLAPRDAGGTLDAAELLLLDEAEFRARFRRTPLWRPKRRGILRNAAIVLGNSMGPLAPRAFEALRLGLHDAEALVRGACAWALGRHADEQVIALLRERLAIESQEGVRLEIEMALGSRVTN